VQEWNCGSAEQNQRCCASHQQEMLHHMRRKHLVIEGAQRRPYRDPDKQQAAQKCNKA